MKQRINTAAEVSPPLQSSAFGALAQLDTTQLPAGNALPAGSPSPTSTSAPRQELILRRETKHRGGKTVVVISGYSGAPEARADLLKTLRKQLGCGGAIEGDEVMLQGDRPSEVAALLQRLGHRVRGTIH